MAAVESALHREHLQVEAALKAECTARQEELRSKHSDELRLLAQEREEAIAAVKGDAQHVLEAQSAQAHLAQAELEARLLEVAAELAEERGKHASVAREQGVGFQVRLQMQLSHGAAVVTCSDDVPAVTVVPALCRNA